MEINIKELIEQHKSKTKANIIDAEEMRIIIPVLLREIVSLKQKLSDADKYIIALEAKKPALERKGSSGNAAWSVKYNTKENRVYIKLTGIYNVKSAKSASNTIINILSHTQKNFDVIVDTFDLEAVADLKVLFHLKKVNFSLQQFNVGRIVRIADKKNKTIGKLFKKGMADFENNATIVNSLENAISFLDNKNSFLKQ